MSIGRVRTWIARVALWGGAAGIAGTMAGFLGELWWPLDYAAHFRFQYLLLLSATAVVLGVFRLPRAALAHAVFALLNLAAVLPFYAPQAAKAAEAEVRVASINLLYCNPFHENAVSFLRETNADFVVLTEVTPQWMAALDSVRDVYPYRVACPRPDPFGIALLSRVPLDESDVVYLGQAEIPSVVGRCRIGDKPLTVLGVHPPSPMRSMSHTLRDELFAGMANYLNSVSGAKVVAGDFNATPWSYLFRGLERNAGMTNSMIGFGVQPTWPAMMGPARIPIDHCLVSSDLLVVKHDVGPFLGSDHYPVVVDLAFSL